VHADAARLEQLARAEADVVDAGNVATLERREDEGFSVDVTLDAAS